MVSLFVAWLMEKIMFGKIFITQLRNCVMLVTPLLTAVTAAMRRILCSNGVGRGWRCIVCLPAARWYILNNWNWTNIHYCFTPSFLVFPWRITLSVCGCLLMSVISILETLSCLETVLVVVLRMLSFSSQQDWLREMTSATSFVQWQPGFSGIDLLTVCYGALWMNIFVD